MKKTSLLLIVMLLMLSACGPAPVATATPDIPGTAVAAAGTVAAATLAALPSATLAPSDTPLPAPTETSVPTDAATPTDAAAPTEAATSEPTAAAALTPTIAAPAQPGVASPTVWEGTLSPGNTDGLPTGLLRIQNNTGVKEIIVTLSGVTMTREKLVYYSYKVTGSLNITILWARYKYVILIPGKKTYTGTFGQNSKDKTLMKIDLTKVVIVGP